MHRSSESIGAIAAALAKAQAELSNPEKSLIGIIGPSTLREPGRAFRYAPLSSGLEIVRKSLGRHAIAIVQSTAIDQEAGLVRRVRPAHDRRSILVVLTDEGRETMERARRHHRHGIEQHFSRHLAEADIKALSRALEKVSAHARPLRPGRISSSST